MKNKKNTIITILFLAILTLVTYLYTQKDSREESQREINVNNFDECVATGNPILESYPEKCIHEGRSFTKKIDVDKSPSPKEEIDIEEEDTKDDFEKKEEAIISALADEYNKDKSEVSINVTKEEGDYVRGGVEFAPGGRDNSGMFLATEYNGEWIVVYDGNGQADCNGLINDYGFPMNVLTGICE